MENLILLIFGILFIFMFFGLAAVLCLVCELICPKFLDKLDKWLDIPDDEWEKP